MNTAVWFAAVAAVASFHHASAAPVLLHAGGGDPTAPPAGELAHPERALQVGMWWADFDTDGLNDAYAISLTGAGHLLRNVGDGTFQDVTLRAGLGAISNPLLAVWNDYDKDGDPDLYIGSSVLMQNNGDGTFQDVSMHVGIGHAGRDLGAEWVDYDRDGHVDLCVRTSAGDRVYHALSAGGFETVDLGLPRATESPMGPLGASETGTPGNGPAARPTPRVRHVLSTGETVPVVTGGGSAPSPEGGASPGNGSVGPFGFALPICADMLLDQTSLACIEADSTPTIGTLHPLSTDFNLDPASGNVRIGTVAANPNFEVSALGIAGAGMGAVRGVGFDSTPGYLGVQASTDFDGVLSADWPSYELGVVGISMGAAAGDNYGVMGHSNGVAVRGENSGAPTTDFGELGLAGIGLRASGSTLAGDFLGAVTLRGSSGGLMSVQNNAGATSWSLSGETGSGGALVGNNDAGVRTVDLDNDSSGGARLELAAPDGDVSVVLDGDGGTGGGILAARSANGSTTVVMDAESDNSGGRVGVFNNTSVETVRIVGDRASSNSGGISLFDRNGANQTSIVLEAEDNIATGSQIRLEGTTAGQHTIEIDGSDGSVGQLDILEVDGSVAFRFLTSSFTLRDAAGAVTQTYNRLTGTKSAVVPTQSYGRRVLYVLESPEIWFEDFGSSKLSNGAARVDLDPVFLETVTINEQHPMKVFITLTSDCNGVFVEKGRDHFVVRELAGGKSNASFDWRMVAKRRGLEDARLDDWAVQEAAMMEGTDAAFLHPAVPEGRDQQPQKRGNPSAHPRRNRP
jgi:hypothetical protein